MAGEYVGLTGARLDGAEMFACGLATHFVPLEVLIDLSFSKFIYLFVPKYCIDFRVLKIFTS